MTRLPYDCRSGDHIAFRTGLILGTPPLASHPSSILGTLPQVEEADAR